MTKRGRCCLAFFLLISTNVIPAQSLKIQSVQASSGFFNPTAGEKVLLNFLAKESGVFNVHVVDRDGYVIRTLALQKNVGPGKISFEWDGRDDSGTIVPDEAYSFKIDLIQNGSIETFFPANLPSRVLPVFIDYYDRSRGIVSYQLAKAARVHLQGVVARTDPKTKRSEGPVLKTIVNRAPRSEGRVVEFWNGFNDDDESIYLPDHPNFKLAVAATELPFSSVITLGNLRRPFAEHVLTRKGISLFTFRTADHRHHQGLSTFEDVSPQLQVRITNGKKLEKPALWRTNGSPLVVTGTLEGPGADIFQKQPGRLWIFVDEQKVLDLPPPQKSFMFEVPLEKNFPGEHILTLNWISEYGPVAVNALRFSSTAPDAIQPTPQSTVRKNQ